MYLIEKNRKVVEIREQNHYRQINFLDGEAWTATSQQPFDDHREPWIAKLQRQIRRGELR